MSINPILSALSTFIKHPIQTSTDLAPRIQAVYKKSEEARGEVQGTGLLIAAPTALGVLAGTLISKFGHRAFSLRTTLKCGSIGTAAGMLISLLLIYSFISQFKKRERTAS